MKLRIFLISAFCVVACNMQAQKPWRIKQIYRAHPPKAILVQLFTYPRRMDYYKRTRNTSEMKDFRAEAHQASMQIVSDFNENFDFCPVYYYYDSNAHFIRERKFDGVLLTRDLTPAKDILLKRTDTNFFIVTNSMLMSEDFLPNNMYGETESQLDANDNVNSTKPRIVVLDHKFRQLPRNTVRTPKGPEGERRSRDHYIYRSRKYNLLYTGKASTLNSNFYSFYNADYDH